jgi:ATP/maltotriose-dependent transcriptional regulator MalT
MAGLVLMAERLRQTGDLRQVSRTDSLETVFDYFPGQILDTAAPETRHVMLCTGLLPNVTADNADAVTGLSNAIEHVEQLFRRRLFVDRAQGLSVSLLNDPDTIRHRSGRLSINPAKC